MNEVESLISTMAKQIEESYKKEGSDHQTLAEDVRALAALIGARANYVLRIRS